MRMLPRCSPRGLRSDCVEPAAGNCRARVRYRLAKAGGWRNVPAAIRRPESSGVDAAHHPRPVWSRGRRARASQPERHLLARHIPWRLVITPQYVSISTGPVQVQVDRSTSAVRFLDAHGTPILSETPGGRSLTPVTLAAPTAADGVPLAAEFRVAVRRRHLRSGAASTADEPGQHELSRDNGGPGAGEPRSRDPIPDLQPGLRPALG